MTPEILEYLKSQRKLIGDSRIVFEVGSCNVNGTAKNSLDYISWLGADIEAGPDVDVLVTETEIYADFLNNARYYPDTILSCECLEHTKDPIATVNEMKRALLMSKTMRTAFPDDYKLILTAPSYHFQYHAYPKDYYRFSTDTFTDVFFDGMRILDLRYLDSNEGPKTTVAGIAILP